jgi:hypothetical protein
MRRRDLLLALPALTLTSVQAALGPTPGPTRLAAAWALGERFQAGWLAQVGETLQVQAALDLPTRAHGIALDTRGGLLVVARRPGDWLLHWPGASQAPRWHWSAAERAFNGHALLSADGRRLYTTETDLDSGAGLVGVRDARTLTLLDEWPTGGRDPHALLQAADGSLIVANGGLETRPETGRIKLGLDQMDASLVRLDATGRTLGRWTLDDARLSIRHLAAHGPRVAVALQAEHDDGAQRAQAPVLALFDGRTLRPVPAPLPLQGYGGDVALGPDTVAVSCPRAGGVAVWSADGEWQGLQPLPEANALALAGDRLWAGGHPGAAALGSGRAGHGLPAGLRLDNHWRVAIG